MVRRGKEGEWLALERCAIDYMWFGHWHQPARLVLADGKITTWCSPSLESSNRFAQEVVGASGEPGQWLMFFDGDGEVSAEYLIRLR